MLRGLIRIVFLSATSWAAVAQAQPKETGTPADKNFPTTLQPVNPVKYYGPRKGKKTKGKSATYNARKEYNDRVEKAMRNHARNELSLESIKADENMKPPYFGHKRPPKIHRIGKRKYCKVCGIRH